MANAPIRPRFFRKLMVWTWTCGAGDAQKL
jgi:hypothetical protein